MNEFLLFHFTLHLNIQWVYSLNISFPLVINRWYRMWRHACGTEGWEKRKWVDKEKVINIFFTFIFFFIDGKMFVTFRNQDWQPICNLSSFSYFFVNNHKQHVLPKLACCHSTFDTIAVFCGTVLYRMILFVLTTPLNVPI